MSEKEEAFRFLSELHRRLDTVIAPAAQTQQRISELEAIAKTDRAYKHFCGREHTFTKGIALPAIYSELTTTFNMAAEDAKQSIMAEGFSNMPELSSNTPARKARHPFNKALVSDPHEIYSKWAEAKIPLTQSCPDFSFRNPFPYKIVFEAKYYERNSRRVAERELVNSAYQAFFYRGLPKDMSNPSRPWDYKYSCVFVYDATEEGHFKAAWESLDNYVKSGFWEGANVYVMVLRGSYT
jgi:hypothetical protein